MSDTQETLEKTLSLVQQELNVELQKSQDQKNSQGDALQNREQLAQECLARAKSYYSKKEWTRAFAEWDKVCVFLDEREEFRSKIASLKESHENLDKVNRELAEIKAILNQRSSPSPADRQFVQNAHEQTSGQIKNVYSYLSQQLRTERTPKTLSFWWPVILAVILIGAGYGVLFGYYGKINHESKRETEKSDQTSQMELATLQAERDELLKKTTDLKQDYENKIEELKQQNAGWRNARHETDGGMENKEQELNHQNEELNRKLEVLIQDNLSKDRQISDLQDHRS